MLSFIIEGKQGVVFKAGFDRLQCFEKSIPGGTYEKALCFDEFFVFRTEIC